MAVDNVDVDVPTKFGDSRSNGLRDIRGAAYPNSAKRFSGVLPKNNWQRLQCRHKYSSTQHNILCNCGGKCTSTLSLGSNHCHLNWKVSIIIMNNVDVEKTSKKLGKQRS